VKGRDGLVGSLVAFGSARRPIFWVLYPASILDRNLSVILLHHTAWRVFADIFRIAPAPNEASRAGCGDEPPSSVIGAVSRFHNTISGIVPVRSFPRLASQAAFVVAYSNPHASILPTQPPSSPLLTLQPSISTNCSGLLRFLLLALPRLSPYGLSNPPQRTLLPIHATLQLPSRLPEVLPDRITNSSILLLHLFRMSFTKDTLAFFGLFDKLRLKC